jgi:hypothetical protein
MDDSFDSIIESFNGLAEYCKTTADDLLYMEMKIYGLAEDFKELVDTMKRRSEGL